MKNHFKTLSQYNCWANSHLYEACSQLLPEEYLKDRKAFFKSIHGTLNHILVADRLWIGRFKHADSGIKALNQILCEDFASLSEARKNEDYNIIEYIDLLNTTKLDDQLSYKTLAGKEQAMVLKWLLAHFFNHQPIIVAKLIICFRRQVSTLLRLIYIIFFSKVRVSPLR